MARSERQEDGTRNGVGTLTRPGTRPRPRKAAEAGQAAPDPRRGRTARPVPPQGPAGDQQAPSAQRPGTSARTGGRRDQRVPFRRAAGHEAVGRQRSAAGRRAGGQPSDTAPPAAAPRRPRRSLRAGVPPQAPPADRTRPRRGSVTGPEPAVTPAPARALQAQPQDVRQGSAITDPGSHRTPFVLLLCGLLGGALVSALVISTTLAEGSFQISRLQASTNSLAKQQQVLEQEVAQAQSPQQIAQRASQLGMRRPGELRFIDLTTGKVTSDGPTWSGAANAPGYAP